MGIGGDIVLRHTGGISMSVRLVLRGLMEDRGQRTEDKRTNRFPLSFGNWLTLATIKMAQLVQALHNYGK